LRRSNSHGWIDEAVGGGIGSKGGFGGESLYDHVCAGMQRRAREQQCSLNFRCTYTRKLVNESAPSSLFALPKNHLFSTFPALRHTCIFRLDS
jgi:hypothetical protein